MTPFFLPRLPDGSAGAEHAYSELREQAEACIGSPSRERRIQEIECRRQGVDCCLRVGEADASNGMTVAAILQMGRDTYTVHHVPAERGVSSEPTVLQRTEIYSVTDFD
jgi:hypothetical protein